MSEDRATSKFFRKFQDNLKAEIASFKVPEEDGIDRLDVQRRQMEELFDLEEQFRDSIWKHRYGRLAYIDFCNYVISEKRSLLDARPYFRERQKAFTDTISAAIRDKDIDTIVKYRINYRFIDFVIGTRKWGKPIVDMANKIKVIRTELTVTNMPLVISQARQFYSKTPKSHLDYMDLVGIATEGLMAAIDKFEPPFSQSFRPMIVQRCVGGMIDLYNTTMLHFYPRDRRILYRTHKARSKNPDLTPDELAKAVNEGQPDRNGQIIPIKEAGGRTTGDEVASLTQAASHVSADYTGTPESNDGVAPLVKQYESPQETRPDIMAEKADLDYQLSQALGQLTIFEQKFLRLRGIG